MEFCSYNFMNVNEFKDYILSLLKEYTVEYSFYKKSDFGCIHHFSFESSNKGGCIFFSESGWLHIDIITNNEQVYVATLSPEENKENIIRNLKTLVSQKNQ